MESGNKYRVLNGLAVCLTLIGILLLFVGGVWFLIALVQFSDTSQQGIYRNINYAAAVWKFAAAVSFVISGLISIAMAETIRVFMDIALNTAHIPQMAQDSAKLVTFFEHVLNKNGSTSKAEPTARADEQPVDKGNYEGYSWWSYEDKHVVAIIDGERKTFPSGYEFTEYLRVNKKK